MTLTSVVLPPPDGPHDGDELAGLDRQIDVLQHEGLAVGVAEEDVAQLDPALDRPGVGQRLVVARFRAGSARCRTGAPDEAEDAEVERLLDECDGLLDEVLLVAHEGEDHADGQAGSRAPASPRDRP